MKKNITIFWGGVDDERAVSQQSYLTVINNIDTNQYNVDSIEIAQDGTWVKDDGTIEPEQALLFTDYAWIAGHGEYMEDGQLQKVLDDHRVPYNGSDALMSQICFSKSATKDLFELKGIQTPVWQSHNIDNVNPTVLADELFQNFPQPCVIKPDRGGSSFGVSIARTKTEIAEALAKAREFTDKVVVEEYIGGTEATVGIVDGLREKKHYVLPVVEITPTKQFFDYEAKYEDAVEFTCPATFEDGLKKQLGELALRVHAELGLAGYSRTDFIIHPDRGVYVLEVNTLPGMTSHSLIPLELEAVGVELKEFFSHVISLG